MLGKSKLNSIEILISQILIDLEISHEEFKTIERLMKEESMEKWKKKKKIRMMESNDERWIKWIQDNQ